MYVDARTYMIDDVLTKVDRMSMAVSLEAREPLLDHKLLEFAAGVPAALKLRHGQGKYLLRRVLERRVPREIIDRPKRGFAAPIGQWLRGPLAGLTSALLLDGRLRDRGIFETREVTRIWDEHRSGRVDHPHRLWQLVMLELWFRQFVDGAPAASGSSESGMVGGEPRETGGGSGGRNRQLPRAPSRRQCRHVWDRRDCRLRPTRHGGS